MEGKAHTWTFERIGGVNQVLIKDGDDIANLSGLDQKLWAALSVPVGQKGLQQTLELLDEDKDGKVRAPDILRFIDFLKKNITDMGILMERSDILLSSRLLDATLRDGIAKVHEIAGSSSEAVIGDRGTGSPDEKATSLAQIEDAIARLAQAPFNGDGVIVPASASDEGAAGLIKTIVDAGYAVSDASGAMGIGEAELRSFRDDAKAFLDWRAEAEARPELLPLGEKTGDALALLKAIRPAVDDFFRRCQVLAMAGSDACMAELQIAFSSALSHSQPEDSTQLAELPAALPNSEGILYLDKALNPLLEKPLAAFFGMAGRGRGGAVGREEWEKLRAAFAEYEAWNDSKPGTKAAALDAGALADILGTGDFEGLEALIGQDAARAEYADVFRRLRAMSLIKRDFLRILVNFVNLEDFYARRQGSFQSGRLYLDAREMELCMDVSNSAAHAAMAGLSSMYLLYCDLTSRDGRKKSIVAAITAGDADNVYVGRNGLYYDRDGEDWDAVITKIVVQPISIREAFFSPYKFLVKTIEDLATRRAASAEAASMAKMKGAAEATAAAGKPEAKPETAAAPKKIDVGTVAAIGVALGSIGAMVTGILGIFVNMGPWLPLGVLIILLLISGPSMILAYIKLRKRNIGPLLNAEGWAVNSRLKVNVLFGRTLSHLAVLPAGSAIRLKDPFAGRKKTWILYVILGILMALAVCYFAGWLNPLLGL